MTIYDISKKAGVSIATVSRVLNGSSSVSEKTKQKVLKVIREYEYTPNAFARGLGLNTMNTIGILCADSSDLYIAKAIYYLEGLLHTGGYDTILCCSGYELKNKRKSMNLLINKKVDGIILVGSTFINESMEDNQFILDAAGQVPVMLLNGALEAPNVYSILSDDYTSIYDAARYLQSTGIHDLLYYYNSISYSGKKKIAGFRDALEADGHPNPDSMIHYYPGSHEDIPGMAHHLQEIAKHQDFHGIVTADDTLAMGAFKYAHLTGRRVPEDLSIIGYNNSMLVNCCEPALSSIDNKLEVLCRQLTATLIGALNGEEMPRTTYFSGSLVHRGTTL